MKLKKTAIIVSALSVMLLAGCGQEAEKAVNKTTDKVANATETVSKTVENKAGEAVNKAGEIVNKVSEAADKASETVSKSDVVPESVSAAVNKVSEVAHSAGTVVNQVASATGGEGAEASTKTTNNEASNQLGLTAGVGTGATLPSGHAMGIISNTSESKSDTTMHKSVTTTDKNGTVFNKAVAAIDKAGDIAKKVAHKIEMKNKVWTLDQIRTNKDFAPIAKDQVGTSYVYKPSIEVKTKDGKEKIEAIVWRDYTLDKQLIKEEHKYEYNVATKEMELACHDVKVYSYDGKFIENGKERKMKPVDKDAYGYTMGQNILNIKNTETTKNAVK